MTKTIRQCFEFGFEEMKVQRIDDRKSIYHHREDFEDADGLMCQFYDYPVNKFEQEFGVIVWFS